jgi:hypothetical protein
MILRIAMWGYVTMGRKVQYKVCYYTRSSEYFSNRLMHVRCYL